jgi:hypothetical protein
MESKISILQLRRACVPNVSKRETRDSQSVISAHVAIRIRDKENYDLECIVAANP